MHKQKGYGQFCPVAKAAEIVAERWTLLVLRELMCGSTRFNELRKGVPLMSPSLLSKRLVQLQDAGLVERRDADSGPEYHLTESGHAMHPIVVALGNWGHRYVQHNIQADDLDPALLMWDVRRGVDRSAFPAARRTVVRFDLAGVAASARRRWWLVFDNDDVDLCLRDPGHDIDLNVYAALRDLTEVWIGHQTLRNALSNKAIRLEGASPFVLGFSHWFALSPFASAPR